jgi:hypothetical protein
MSAQLETLKRHQSWRRGDDTEMPQPADVGEAIDYAIAIIEAAENLLAVKGRHHSEQAYGRMAAAFAKHTKDTDNA